MLAQALENTAELQGSSDFSASAGTGLSGLYFPSLLRLGNLDASGSDASGMQPSDTLLRFLMNAEGFSATAYRGADAQNLTIGYGHVLQAGENYTALTQTQAVSLLQSDLSKYVSSVKREFAGTDLTQGQFDALVSFSYNLGANIWSKTPKLVADVKAGAGAETIREDFTRCSNCNGRFLRGLYNRRVAEWQMYEGSAE